MFSDFIAPIDTTSSSADIDSPNSFASYYICVPLRFRKKNSWSPSTQTPVQLLPQ
jgi:hypothetical protein